ncbi:heterokaryon incompatibility protein-domain-containing protein, partial [Phyllosticta citricarpa]
MSMPQISDYHNQEQQEIPFHISDSLCPACHQLVKHILAKDFSLKCPRIWQSRSGEKVVHHIRHNSREYFRSLHEKNALSSCPLCEVILESMWNKNAPHPFFGSDDAQLPSWDHVWVYIESFRSDCPEIDGVYAHLGQIPSWKGQDYLLLSMPLDILQRLGASTRSTSGEYILPELPCDAPYHDIHRWVDDCVNCRRGHENCDRKKSVLPTRVIDVQSNPPKVVLSHGKSDIYVALSHCWGGLIETRLLHKTFDAFTAKGIPEETLPPTFRDALFVIRQLGIRWIWIDALCIIQDDDGDWEREALLMSQVYQQAAFVLSAYSTPGSKAGLGFRRAARVARLQKGEDVYIQRAFIDMSDTFHPLGGRGWCLQEHVLAFAVLQMGRGHIEWNCPAGFYTEKEPHVLQTENKNVVLNLVTASLGVTSQERAWRHVAQNFTERGLTFESDKMVALAGVVTMFETGLPHFAHTLLKNPTYVVGLWQETLFKDLMWATNPYAKVIPRRDRAPSWSWIAWDGPVTWTLQDQLERGLHYEQFCDVDLASVQLTNTSKAAKRVFGRVDLSGLLVFLAATSIKRPDVRSVAVSLRNKVVTDDNFFEEVLKHALLGAPGTEARDRRDLHGSIDRDTEAPSWALRLAGYQAAASQWNTLFMMLEQVPTAVGRYSGRLFRRVGMLMVATYDEPRTPVAGMIDDRFGWSGENCKVTI